MHVRFPHGERIDICARVEICKTVVDKPVRGLVRSDSIDDVEESRIWVKTPVVDCDFGGGQV